MCFSYIIVSYLIIYAEIFDTYITHWNIIHTFFFPLEMLYTVLLLPLTMLYDQSHPFLNYMAIMDYSFCSYLVIYYSVLFGSVQSKPFYCILKNNKSFLSSIGLFCKVSIILNHSCVYTEFILFWIISDLRRQLDKSK